MGYGNHDLPAAPTDVRHGPPDNATFQGWFEKSRLVPLDGYGQYRRRGRIYVSASGLTIEGRHVLPAAIRLAIGLPLCLLGLMVGYGVVEYVLLKTETVFVPWPSVEGFVIDARESRVGLALDGPPQTSPVVIRAENAPDLYSLLQRHIPNADMGAGTTKGRPLVVVAAIVIGTVAITWVLAALGLLK
jgi:hypothetical protein